MIDSVSCTAPGDCGAGGYYTDAAGNQQAFVATEAGGIWHSAREVPGTAGLDLGSPGWEVLSVSCATAGDCGAGGFYTDAAGQQQAFIAAEASGTWHSAQEVPGSGAANACGYAEIASVSCAAAGDCSAGGYYASASVDRIPTVQALVVTETGGTWHPAREVPGTAALNARGYAALTSVSCTAVGDRSAGGEYTDSTAATEPFVLSETGGNLEHGPRDQRNRGPQQQRARLSRLGVVRLAGQLQRRRVLSRRQLHQPGVRGRPGGRNVGRRAGGSRHRSPQPGHFRRRSRLGLVRRRGCVQPRRLLLRCIRTQAGLRRQ